jgi:hypothetical protein
MDLREHVQELEKVAAMCTRLRNLAVVDVGAVAGRTMERLGIMKTGANAFVLSGITVAGCADASVVRIVGSRRLRCQDTS